MLYAPQPKKNTKSNLVHISLKIWHLMATILITSFNWTNYVQIKANWHQIGLPSYLRIRGKAPRNCKIITTLWETLAAYIALLLLILFVVSVAKTEKRSVVFLKNWFFLSLISVKVKHLTCWLPLGDFGVNTNVIVFMKHARGIWYLITFQYTNCRPVWLTLNSVLHNCTKPKTPTVTYILGQCFRLL